MSAPTEWIVYMGVGGYVCAATDPAGPDGTCGMPVETEPCPIHDATDTTCQPQAGGDS